MKVTGKRAFLSIPCAVVFLFCVTVSTSGCSSCGSPDPDTDNPSVTTSCLSQACGGSPTGPTGNSGNSGSSLGMHLHPHQYQLAAEEEPPDDDDDCG